MTCCQVSVVIPTKNSASTIERCLTSIKNQTYPCIEIIVVDNYSEDRTVEIAKLYGAKTFNKGPERCAQVNFGIYKSTGNYIYRVDSDFVLDRGVISECVKECENGFDAVIVHNISDPSISFWSKVRNLERECYRNDELNVAARFFKRSVFEHVGMFDENLVACEDYDLHNRLIKEEFEIGTIKSNETHIGEPKSILEIAKKHYYYGKTIDEFIKKNPNNARKQLTPFRYSYLKNWRNFIRKPMLSIGFIIYQMVRYTFAGFGFLSSKVDINKFRKGDSYE